MTPHPVVRAFHRRSIIRLRGLAAIAPLLSPLACLPVSAQTPTAQTPTAQTPTAQTPSRAEPRPVRVQAVTFARSRPSVTYSGTIAARVMADLAFRVPGKMVARAVNVGDRVSANQMVAQLDPTTLQLELEIAQNDFAAAEAEAANARVSFARYDQMGRGSAAFVESEHDSRRAAARAAEARFERARRHVQMAQIQRYYATLRADADGVVVAAPVEPGQVVAPGQKIIVLAHGADTEIAINVPENRLDDIRAAEAVEIVLLSAPSRPLRGRVREIGALADSATRTFAVKVSVLDPGDARLSLGMTVAARFVGPPGEPRVILPATALTSAAGEPAVWVLDEKANRAARVAVRVAAFRGDDTVEIGAGLSPGQLVVTAGADLIDRDLPVTAWRGTTR